MYFKRFRRARHNNPHRVRTEILAQPRTRVDEHVEESSWRSRRPGTSKGSLIFANGAPGMMVEVDWRSPAKSCSLCRGAIGVHELCCRAWSEDHAARQGTPTPGKRPSPRTGGVCGSYQAVAPPSTG